MVEAGLLPTGVSVLERGWLSANNIVFTGRYGTALVDTGYVSHSAQTITLMNQALGGRALDFIFNTHLHSDHCGGNAALQAQYPNCKTFIPSGLAELVRSWDEEALSYTPTGQNCPRFFFDGVLRDGEMLELGNAKWQVHSAPGHDPHSIILFEPVSATLIAADALWENGFGVVFPELQGEPGFLEVGQTLDLIESLKPQVVIPGHGPVFKDAPAALVVARRRLEAFIGDPVRHAKHAAKVLLKFKLLEMQRIELNWLVNWAASTRYFNLLHVRHFSGAPLSEWLQQLMDDLERSGALRFEGGWVLNN